MDRKTRTVKQINKKKINQKKSANTSLMTGPMHAALTKKWTLREINQGRQFGIKDRERLLVRPAQAVSKKKIGGWRFKPRLLGESREVNEALEKG